MKNARDDEGNDEGSDDEDARDSVPHLRGAPGVWTGQRPTSAHAVALIGRRCADYSSHLPPPVRAFLDQRRRLVRNSHPCFGLGCRAGPQRDAHLVCCTSRRVLFVYVCVYAGLGCEPQLRAIQFAVLWVDVEFAEHGTIISLAIIAIEGTQDDARGGAVHGRPQLELVVAADPCCIPCALPLRPLRVTRALAALGYCLGVLPSSYSTHCCRTVCGLDAVSARPTPAPSQHSWAGHELAATVWLREAGYWHLWADCALTVCGARRIRISDVLLRMYATLINTTHEGHVLLTAVGRTVHCTVYSRLGLLGTIYKL